jgi:Alginate export
MLFDERSPAKTTALMAAGLVAWSARASAQVPPPAPETIAVGDWELAPVAEVRVRGEYTHGLDDQDWVFLTERARLGLDVQRGPVEARVVLQDAHAWDVGALAEPFWTPPRIGVTGAYEAWAEARTASARPLSLRIGRQPISWGEGRLLGIADWSPAGRSLDAVRARAPVGDGAIELLAASLSDPTTAPLVAYGELFGARAQWAIHPLFAAEAYVFARLAQAEPPAPASNAVRGQTYTGALHLYGDSQAWTWGVEAAYQLGHVEESHRARQAWAAAGHLAHTFERVMLLPTIRVGASYATGDDGGSTYRAFDPILPDVHVWHGAMDLFSWSNEKEANTRVAIAPWTDAIAAVEYRYVSLVETAGQWTTAYGIPLGPVAPAGPPSSNTSPDLGHEIDAVVTWAPWSSLELTAGYSALVLGEGARAILRASEANEAPPRLSHFAYAQLTLRVP